MQEDIDLGPLADCQMAPPSEGFELPDDNGDGPEFDDNGMEEEDDGALPGERDTQPGFVEDLQESEGFPDLIGGDWREHEE